MSEGSKVTKDKYFCVKCRDRNFLKVCGCNNCDGIIPHRNKEGRLQHCIRFHNVKHHRVYESKEARKKVRNEKAKLQMRKYRKTQGYKKTFKKYYKDNKEKYKQKNKEFRQKNPTYIRDWEHKNKDRVLLLNARYRERNRDSINKRSAVRRKLFPQKFKMASKKYYNKKSNTTIKYCNGPLSEKIIINESKIFPRAQLMNMLGAKCVMCGYRRDYRALQIDHINGKGCDERRLFGGSAPLYRYYLARPKLAFKTLQVLCANCNALKRIDNNENPNKYKRVWV